MNLLDIPEEIIIMIIKKVDLLTARSLFDSCSKFRRIISSYGFIKQCKMSRNTMASEKCLKLDFFKAISPHIQELNLCGVHDLKKTSLIAATKRLKCLLTLDVSYTNITLVDMLDIYQTCPTIKNVSINFRFCKMTETHSIKTIPQNILLQCQSLLANFVNVHFIGGAFTLLYYPLAQFILSKTKLNSLKYSVVEHRESYTVSENSDLVNIIDFAHCVHFTSFYIFFLNWKRDVLHGILREYSFFYNLSWKDHEFVIIAAENVTKYSIYVSARFIEYFKVNFNIDAQCVTELNWELHGNVVVMFWNKVRCVFDSDFYNKLTKNINEIYSFHFETDTELLRKCDWYNTMPVQDIAVPPPTENIKKKKRIAPANYVLNYDNQFKDLDNFQFSLIFSDETMKRPVTLPSSCDYVNKMTYLSLTGSVVYSGEFFNILFRTCGQLYTLNVEAPTKSPCASAIARSVPLSASLKNLRIVDKRIDFCTLFLGLSQCKTLENVNLIDMSPHSANISDPQIMFENCGKLYYLYIFAFLMTESARAKNTRLLKKAREKCGKHHLFIELFTSLYEGIYCYNPYVDVFKLNPIKLL